MSWEKGTRHLRKDPLIGPIISRHGALKHKKDRHYFRSLVFAIVSQQISGKAASALMKRIENHYGKPTTPAKVLAADVRQLRQLGLSAAKAAYVHDLAARFADGAIRPRYFARMIDEEVIATLTKVRGVGRWTAEMFLIFSLERLDVFPVDDYGVQKAAQQMLGLKELPRGARLAAIGERWRPYRSVATLYIWKSLDSVLVKTKK
jgi:DNA-3-methyladenine glycosylase II